MGYAGRARAGATQLLTHEGNHLFFDVALRGVQLSVGQILNAAPDLRLLQALYPALRQRLVKEVAVALCQEGEVVRAIGNVADGDFLRLRARIQKTLHLARYLAVQL